MVREALELTRKVLHALACVPSFSAAAPAVVLAGPRVAEVDLCLTVVPGEANGTAAAQAVDGVDGPEQNCLRGDKGRRTVELQHRHALHVVFARLPQADVVIEG